MQKISQPILYHLRAIFPLILFCLTLLCHASSLKNEFNIDDSIFLSGDSQVFFRTIQDFFTKAPDQHYAPFNYLIPFALFKIFPPNPIWFHGINLALFYLNCLLLYQLILKISVNQTLAIITSALFCIHPMNATIMQRISFNTSILVWMAWMEAAMIFFWQYATRPSKKNIALSLIFFLGALLTHELALLFPLLAGILLVVAGKISIRKTIHFLVPFLAVGTIFLFFWWVMAGRQSELTTAPMLFPLTVPSYLASLSYLTFWYLGNLLWPSQIVFMRNIPPIEQSSFLLIALLAAFILGGFVLLARWKKNLAALGLLWFVTGFLILPVMILAHTEIGLIIEPHWFYFSSIGFFLLAGAGIEKLKEWIPQNYFWIGIAVLASALFTTAQMYHHVARTEESFNLHWLKKSPDNPIALMGMGDVYLKKGDHKSAFVYYHKVATKSRFLQHIAYNQMARIAIEQGDIDVGQKFIQASLSLNPREAKTYVLLGAIYLIKKDLPRAEQTFRYAAYLVPNFPLPYVNLLNIYMSQREYVNAIRTIEKLQTLPSPRQGMREDLRMRLAALYLCIHESSLAYALIEQLTQTTPPERVFLGVSFYLEQLQAGGLAERFLEDILSRGSPSKALFAQLGVLLAKNGRVKEGILYLEKALSLAPGDPDLMNTIQKIKDQTSSH